MSHEVDSNAAFNGAAGVAPGGFWNVSDKLPTKRLPVCEKSQLGPEVHVAVDKFVLVNQPPLNGTPGGRPHGVHFALKLSSVQKTITTVPEPDLLCSHRIGMSVAGKGGKAKQASVEKQLA